MAEQLLPTFDLKRNYQTVRKETLAALDKVLESQSFILGSFVRSFEEDCEAYLGTAHAIGCASGSDALLLALHSLDVKAGDKVITTPFTFFATASAITRLGAVPLFVDIDPSDYNLSVEGVKEALADPKVKVCLPVHLFGQMAKIEELIPLCDQRQVALVEDAAQAFGAVRHVADQVVKAGTVGKIGCYSFFPTKNLGAYGDAGMMVTDDASLSQRLLRLRVHGASTTYYHDEVGYNSRLDAMQAAVLQVRLRYLELWNEARRTVAHRYALLMAQYGVDEFVTPPVEAEYNRHIYHQYVVRAQRRDEAMEFLQQQGISTRVYYPLPLHLQRCFAFAGYREGQFPESEKLSKEALALPMFPEFTEDEQVRVVEALAKFYRS